MDRRLFLAGVFLSPALVFIAPAQSQVDLARQAKNLDFASAPFTRTVRVGDAIPSTCQTGELFFWRLAPLGANLRGCTSPNTWTALSAIGVNPSITSSTIQDLQVEKLNGTLLRLGGVCSTSAPCKVSIGNSVASFTQAATAQITNGSGTGSAYIYVNAVGQLRIDHSVDMGFSVTCSGCTSTFLANPAFPPNSIPLATVSVYAGQWQTVVDQRSVLGSTPLSAGEGLVLEYQNGVATISANTTILPRLNAMNTWLNGQDFRLAASLKIPAGSGAPSASSCDVAEEGGSLFFRSDAASTQASLYICANTAPGVYAWELVQNPRGGGGGGSNPSSPGLQSWTGSAWSARTIQAGTGLIVSNGSGQNTNPRIDLDSSSVALLGSEQTFAAGAKKSFQANATTAGLRLTPGNNPSAAQTGDIHVNTNNQFLWFDGLAWRNPMINQGTTIGDLNICSTTSTPCNIVRLPAGASGQVLTSQGPATMPSYQTLTASQVTNAFNLTTANQLGANYFDLTHINQPAFPAADNVRTYARNDKLCALSAAGTETCTATADSSAGTILYARPNQTLAAGASAWAEINATGWNSASDPHTAQILVPFASVVRSVHLRLHTVQPATGSLVCTVVRNGSNTALVVIVPSNSSGPSNWSGFTPVSFSALDLLSVRCTNNASQASGLITSLAITLGVL